MPLKHLEWDSELFGRRIARFEGHCFTGADAEATQRLCAERAIDCVYLLLDAADTASIAAAQRCGARFVDIRMTLEAPVSESEDRVSGHHAAGEIRPAAERDVPALRRLAAISHRDTRFYTDSRFDPDRVDLLYQTWIEKSCHGYADAVFVMDGADGTQGYVTCHLDEGPTGRIGLIAVGPDLQGRGGGARLLQTARGWFIRAGCGSWRVATQGANARALRLYQAYGFRTTAVQVWFHLWLEEGAGGRL